MLGLVVRASRRTALGSIPAITPAFKATYSSEICTVCIMDPKFLWNGEAQTSREAQGAERTHVYATIPSALMDQLSQARFRLGDADDPESMWTVGAEGELFEYRFLGAHTVQSGCTAIIRSTPQDAEAYALPPLPDSVKLELQDAISRSHTGIPYHNADVLFMGSLVDAASASVYVHKKGVSLMISSNHEGLS
eukprot:jgi/Ulvmu1/408/UM001_0415.1